ncbi:MAG TPA: endopeptidase La [Herpetosiphon sp.]|uniref:Lon protease n=1 Tax=Herpetosiphon aurantiacus (strain ATCC 23779 / DSM 785 / 114-95) TaxID=316274 RepID=A9AWT0_HERA2|nr:endopeptidase La [Herpetosiphon sp.]ABX03331.1 ATP-dependent protease La [Herpetosiphon aurantiacus DSM 785]HBW50486.1 endopeptidase La [Herpetosiphon sp.]
MTREKDRPRTGTERTLPLVVLGEIVIMPHMTVPLQVGQGKSYRAMEQAMEDDQHVLLIFVSEAEIEAYKGHEPQQLPKVGVVARLEDFSQLPDGTVKIVLEGITRAEIVDCVQSDPFYRVACRYLPDQEPKGIEVDALMDTVKQQITEFVDYLGEIPQEAVAFVHRITTPGHLADLVTYGPAFSFQDRLELLNEMEPLARLNRVQVILARQLELLRLRAKIQSDTKEVLDQGQKEYFLREQMRVIRRELGEDDDGDDPIDELRRKVNELNAPQYVKDQALHEIKRLAQQGMNSPEAGVIRTYLDWIIALPWNADQVAAISLVQSRQVLDEDHYGLEKVKERILEYLAVRKLAGSKMRSPILCFVGPPGVGKTSLGRSIARALDRPFVRQSLGGVHDEAEIRGHRRTYIGAMPGRIIQGMKTAKSRQAVFMLDEIDKIGNDFRGDPTSALLEVLDPEQNNTFSDHYLEIPFDLSQVVFVATANQLEPIPAPLRDRMEIIEIGGYTEDEKLAIAQGFLLPKQREFHGLESSQLELTDAAILKLIREYTREAGVRNLEREVAALCRKIARKVAESQDEEAPQEGKKRRKKAKKAEPTKFLIDAADVPIYLGPEHFSFGMAEVSDQIGVATGVAWTPTGGDILSFEVLPLTGKGELRLTGQLGDVMKESAQAAMSYVRYRAKELGIEPNYFDEHSIHIHVPEGAVPKDGPSAGITLTIALISAMTGRAVRRDVAMTGEVTLRGRVLPIGGLKEKTLAAHRAGIKTFILPKENAKDIVDLPEKVRQDLQLIPVETMDEVLTIALMPFIRQDVIAS